MAIAKNELVKKAQKEYEYLTGDAATRRLQELREKAILDENSAYAEGKRRGKEEGEARGEARGLKQGLKRGKIEIAKKLIKNNVDLDVIAKSTGLSKKELQKLSETLLEKV